MINKLHDLVDAREEFMLRAKERAKEIVRTRFFEAMEQTKDAKDAMELVALLVEDELTDMSTNAVQTSFSLARKMFW